MITTGSVRQFRVSCFHGAVFVHVSFMWYKYGVPSNKGLNGTRQKDILPHIRGDVPLLIRRAVIMAQFTSKKEIVSRLQKQIEEKDATAIHALLFIYDKQETEEQEYEHTHYANGVGFNKADAEFGSSLARQYRERGFLSPKQMGFVRKLIRKYAGQIVEIKLAEGEIRKEGKVYIWG